MGLGKLMAQSYVTLMATELLVHLLLLYTLGALEPIACTHSLAHSAVLSGCCTGEGKVVVLVDQRWESKEQQDREVGRQGVSVSRAGGCGSQQL